MKAAEYLITFILKFDWIIKSKYEYRHVIVEVSAMFLI